MCPRTSGGGAGAGVGGHGRRCHQHRRALQGGALRTLEVCGAVTGGAWRARVVLRLRACLGRPLLHRSALVKPITVLHDTLGGEHCR